MLADVPEVEVQAEMLTHQAPKEGDDLLDLMMKSVHLQLENDVGWGFVERDLSLGRAA